MSFRVDRRTPMIRKSNFEGIPVTEQYMYLGVLMDDCRNIKLLQK